MRPDETPNYPDYKPKVLNKKTDTIPPSAVYVGRPSKWGNPFIMNKYLSRIEVIERYKTHLRGSAELRTSLNELRGKDLVCWCAPQPCHADVLLELANPK